MDAGEEVYIIWRGEDAGRGGGDQFPTRSTTTEHDVNQLILMTWISGEWTDVGEEVYIIWRREETERGGRDQLPTRSTTTEHYAKEPILTTSIPVNKRIKVKKSQESGEERTLGGKEVSSSPPDQQLPNVTLTNRY